MDDGLRADLLDIEAWTLGTEWPGADGDAGDAIRGGVQRRQLQARLQARCGGIHAPGLQDSSTTTLQRGQQKS
jgi:hypothetical protein